MINEKQESFKTSQKIDLSQHAGSGGTEGDVNQVPPEASPVTNLPTRVGQVTISYATSIENQALKARQFPEWLAIATASQHGNRDANVVAVLPGNSVSQTAEPMGVELCFAALLTFVLYLESLCHSLYVCTILWKFVPRFKL